jgi:sugar (pentulose or hexulose) kinase
VSARELAVGVDIGTTETKALAIDARGDNPTGRRVGFARRPTTWVTHPGGRVETTGEAVFADVLGAVSAAVRSAEADGPVRVTGIGLAGLAESGVVLDPAGRVGSPVIAWFDQRGAEELTELAARDSGFAEAFSGRVGLAMDAQCTLAKLLWMRGSGISLRPGVQWLNIPEYVAHTLGADRVTEPSLAARTGLVDASTGLAWSAALDQVGAPPGFLPPVLPAGQSAGRVSHRDAPAALRGAAITVVGHDHPVAAVGSGATEPNVLFNSTGTADVLLRSVPRRLSTEERAQLVASGYSAGAHVLPGYAALIGSVRAGLVLGRVLDLLGRADLAARLELDRRWRPGTATSSVRVTGAGQTDAEVVIRITDGASPDAVWAAALAHIGSVTSALVHSAERIVGEHRDAVAAGGWVRLSSVRASKSQIIPRLRFAAIDQPGAFGAALFAAWAGAGNPVPFRKFSDRMRPERPTGQADVAQPEEATTW